MKRSVWDFWAVQYFVATLIICFVIDVHLKAQSNFQEAYIVSANGDTLYGEIDNLEWDENPDSFSFRASPVSEVQVFTPDDLKAFYVSGTLYKAAMVSIDETPLKVKNVREVDITTGSRKEKVFLAVLVQGETSLYVYKNIRENFYLEVFSNLTALISHENVAKIGGKFFLDQSEAYIFRDQLKRLASHCSSTDIDKVRYSQKDLKKFVLNCYNNRPSAPIFVREKPKPSLSAKLFLGASKSNYDQTFQEILIRYSSTDNLTIGISARLILPRERGSRSIFADVLLYGFNGVYQNKADRMTLDITYLKTNLGYHHEYFTGLVRPFLDIGATFKRQLSHENDGNASFITKDGVMVFHSSSNLSSSNNWTFGGFLGLGMKYKNFNLSLRYEKTFNYLDDVQFRSIYLLTGFEVPLIRN
ncbi:MAG: hypothetical protein WD016_10170 [Balneolaceae bacterium]